MRERSGVNYARHRLPPKPSRHDSAVAAVDVPRLDHYLRYLTHHPEEYRRLYSRLAGSITAFFRDADLFDILRVQVLPELIAWGREQGHQLRLWSARARGRLG
jgi:two-component system CheB/CheR fusion protein